MKLNPRSKIDEFDWLHCSGLPQNGNGISQLAKRCPGLKKLFLTATRVITDIDLKTIALCCPQLRQLDLLGNSYITPEGCSRYVAFLYSKYFLFFSILIYISIFFRYLIWFIPVLVFFSSMHPVISSYIFFLILFLEYWKTVKSYNCWTSATVDR